MADALARFRAFAPTRRRRRGQGPPDRADETPPHLLAEIHEREAVLLDRIATGGSGRSARDAKKRATEARERAATHRAQDAHLKKIAETQTPDEHAAEHERCWPKEIWGPYRTFPDLATARDWCAHCNVWIGTETSRS